MTDINMTFEDYVELIRKKYKCPVEEAETMAKDIFDHYLHDFEDIKNHISLLNETNQSRDKLIKQMQTSTHIKR